MSKETPNFNIGPEGEMTAPAQFTYKDHRVEVVPPDTRRLIAYYWQIKIDGCLKSELLFSSLRVAADRAKELIDQERSADERVRGGANLHHSPGHPGFRAD
jgi:hypothetical protein